jgi:ribose 1,5-bisphosphokinase
MPGQGAIVTVVGPSGVGKDSLLQYAANKLSHDEDFSFIKRSITRPAESGGEIHDAQTMAQFEALERQDEFVVAWQAHGLKYGIPKSAKEFVDTGGVAVVNGSRHALPLFAAAFSNLVVVSVTADTQVITARLRARGRESEQEIRQRLERSNPEIDNYGRIVDLDNSGCLETAGDVFVECLRGMVNLEPERKRVG